jgi:membrane protease YdiL (CAAX protease family)
MHPLIILWGFIKDPTAYIQELDNKTLLRHIFSYVFVGLVMSYSILAGLAYLTPAQMNNVSYKVENNSYNEIMGFIVTVLVAPFYEELFFRGILAKASESLKRFYYFIFLFTVLFSLTQFAPLTQLLKGFPIIGYGIMLVPFSLVLSIITPTKWLYSKLLFRWLVYVTAITFAAVHLGNYNYKTWENVLISPFLIVNQLYLGFVTAYLASRYGLSRSILVHFINNAITVFLASSLTIGNYWLEKSVFLFISLTLFLTAMYCFLVETAASYRKSKNNQLNSIK